MRPLPPIRKSWGEETLIPILVAGYFASWTKIHFCFDTIGGVWGYSYSYPLEYYSTPTLHGFSSLPVQLASITITSAILALATLGWMMPKTVIARLATVLALGCITASVIYSCLALQREGFFADGTRQLILRLESTGDLDRYDQKVLESSRAAYESYLAATNR
jgi:hypothetical protein